MRVIEWKGVKVTTYKHFSEFSGIEENRLKRFHKTNKSFFQENVDYFLLNPSELKELKTIYPGFVDPCTSKILLIGFDMLAYYLTYSARESSQELYKKLCKAFGKSTEYRVLRFNSKEGTFGERLKLILQGICKVETQFPVLDYRVDFYLPEVNLVVEFDENDHKYGKKPEKDKQREKEIQQHLKCRFVRVKEDEPFDISLNRVLKSVFKYLLRDNKELKTKARLLLDDIDHLKSLPEIYKKDQEKRMLKYIEEKLDINLMLRLTEEKFEKLCDKFALEIKERENYIGNDVNFFRIRAFVHTQLEHIRINLLKQQFESQQTKEA